MGTQKNRLIPAHDNHSNVFLMRIQYSQYLDKTIKVDEKIYLRH